MHYRDMEKRKARCEARNKRLAESAVEMKELRIRLGVTQSQLARKTGVTRTLIWSIENGRAYLSDTMLERITKAFPESKVR
jgi:transcriptional regulator with XRE-family HTH domain